MSESPPEHLIRPAQEWASSARRCYKCKHFRSNMPLTGTCGLNVRRGLLNSHDTMPGDGCRAKYDPVWEPEKETT